MFFWLELPAALDAEALLPQAVERGVAFVPGAPFYCGGARAEHAAPVLRHRARRSASSAACAMLAGVLRCATMRGGAP